MLHDTHNFVTNSYFYFAQPRAILFQNTPHDPDVPHGAAIAFGKQQSQLHALPLAPTDEGTYNPVWRSCQVGASMIHVQLETLLSPPPSKSLSHPTLN